ncbi:TonB-dependent receptor [Stakelama sediminis]|uniref:Outer membrane receptor protein involved in Fe transport n=1 Tax=Stakelama sediminis TaxID=463200 RepID=A0A840YVN1_9SPHN|nr:TonB-dependent receptor [Stakelama sediminis]MBB5717617.1 outer membrane receptor protein involved in Fe transport [Stakelama sediminis]
MKSNDSLTRTKLRGSTALQALALICMGSAISIASPAAAQTNDQNASDQTAVKTQQAQQKQGKAGDNVVAPETDNGDIVVTGSLIRRDAFSTMEPLTVITADEITQSGFDSAASALQSTAVTQGASQINNYFGGYVTNGGTGANTLGLRGLGPNRTLILLNGHRLAPAGTRGSVGAADLNVLPTALIKRIEILKAGASSIYGSDAIAGVVNIITDTELNGLVLDGQVNVPEVGAGTSYRLSASFGYSGERLKLIGSLEYYKRQSLAREDENFTKCPIGGYLSGEGTAFGSGDYIDPATGKPKCFTLDNGGVTINTVALPTRQAYDRLTGALGNYNRFVPAPSVTGGPTPGLLGVDYYTRDSFDPRQEKEQLVTPAEIYTGYLQAGYQLDILGDAEVYVELLGNQRHSSNLGYRQLTLDYAQGSPLLPAEYRNGALYNPNEISNGNIVAARSFIGYGNLNSKQEVSFARLGGGLRGNFFFSGWKYDYFASKTFSDGTYETETFLTDRIARSLDVVSDGNGGFVCATTTDPNCVAAPPLNAASVGGNLSDAYRNYITKNVVGTTKYREFLTSLNVNGPIFHLPGGDAQLALGLEYRDASINDTPPQDSQDGNLYNLTSAAITRGSDNVWEAFGEVYLPLAANVPFAYRLNLDASGRYTDYKSYGSGWTYKVSGEWQPVRGVGFRASYGTSYRAPALFEQFLGATSGFLSSSTDPCDDYANSQNPIIQKNCAAIGLPADFQQTSGVTVLSAGGRESGLKAETSTNFSGGIVLQPVLPQSVGSFSLSVDYFRIEVSNGVNRAGAANILNLCYGDTNFQPGQGYCRLVNRDNNNALTVNNNYINLSTDIRRGVEANIRYSRDIGPGRFILNGNVIHYLEQSSKLFPDDPLEDANGTITTPDWVGSFNASYRIDQVTFHYGLDWITGDKNATYNYFSLNPDGTIDQDYKQFLKDNYYFEVPDYFLHNASVQISLKKFQITAGVRNLFNAKLPRITAGGYNMVGNTPLYSGYDYVGRTFFVNTTAKF